MRHRFRAWAGLCVAGLASLSFAACSSDDEPTDTNNENGELAPRDKSKSVYDQLGVEDPKANETKYADKKAPYEDVAGCKAFDAEYPEIHDCTCDKCFDLQQQCDALDGCIEIAECAISIGCKDAYSCYLAPSPAVPDSRKCIPIVDKWGNTGLASAVSLALAACLDSNGCRQ